MYFQLCIHELRRSITRRVLVSETTNIISCDAPTPKLWFSLFTFVTYLGQMEFETGYEYPDIATGYPVRQPSDAANCKPLVR